MTEKRKRRWFQFSLRALLVLVLLVSIGMSWLAVKLEKAGRQKETVEAIEKLGGNIWYDYHITHGQVAEPPVPKWARELLGVNFFCDVVVVDMTDRNVGDDEAIYLKRLTHLKWLGLGSAQITDAGLEHLQGLTNVEWLELAFTQITDAGLEHLQGLAKLKYLGLGGTVVTDAGLEHLKGMSNLESLSLCGTQVTPESVKKLQQALPECEIVY